MANGSVSQITVVAKSTELGIERLRVRIPAGVAGDFSSPELTLCADLFRALSTPMLPQWHVKDPGHSAKSVGGRLHLSMHTPLTPVKSEWADCHCPGSVGTYRETSSGSLPLNIRPQSSQLAEPLWTGLCIKSGITVHKLYLHFKKKSAVGE